MIIMIFKAITNVSKLSQNINKRTYDLVALCRTKQFKLSSMQSSSEPSIPMS
jgi:hypothetical protein